MSVNGRDACTLVFNDQDWHIASILQIIRQYFEECRSSTHLTDSFNRFSKLGGVQCKRDSKLIDKNTGFIVSNPRVSLHVSWPV